MAALMTANEISEPEEDQGDVVKLKPGAHYSSEHREMASPITDIDHQSHRDGSAGVQSETTKQQANGSVQSQNESVPKTQVPVLSHTPGEKGFEDSTTALLRRYTAERNGRPTSIHLTSKGEIDGASSLMDTFRVLGKLYTVTLDEDQLSWVSQGKKDPKKETLYLSDIFSVVHGQPSSTPVRPQSSSPSHPRRNHTPSKALDFTVFALKSVPGTVGHPVKVTFKGQSADTCQLWAEQIGHQMMNFGNRPRKLFVVINPASGDNPAAAERIWQRVLRMFEMAQIHTDVLYTQHRFHAREHIQSLDLAQYDGMVAVGGDGLFNEVLNGVMIMTQQQSGVNLRHPRFIPVTPTIRLGIIPIGFTNSIARSLFGSKSPIVAAAQIMLGCSSPVDICTVTQNNQLLLFSAGPMAYGFWSDTALFSQDFSWLGSKRLEVAMIRTLVSLKHFEAELSFIPVTEEPEEDTEDESVTDSRSLKGKKKCFNRCPMCSHFDVSDASPSAKHEKGASIMAGSEVDRIDDRKWKKFSGQLSSVMACPNICSTSQAPHGSSPYSHMGNGCLDLVMLTRCSRLEHAKWLFRQRRGTQLDHPHVHVRRVKEFKFREILKPTRSVRNTSHDNEDNMDVTSSVDNLVQEVDDDEATNSRAGRANQTSREGTSVAMPTSSWNIDGDEILKADIDIRVHRHLLAIFARGPEPFDNEATSLSSHSSEDMERTDVRDDLIPGTAANT